MTDHAFKIYSINFYAPGIDLGYFESFLRYDPDILGFWNYIPLVYLVKTNLSVGDLAFRVRNRLQGNHCLVAEVNPYNVDGWLPKPAWDWFRSPPEKQAGLLSGLSASPQQGRGLGGLFGRGGFPPDPFGRK
jgi:hypothetical protein